MNNTYIKKIFLLFSFFIVCVSTQCETISLNDIELTDLSKEVVKQYLIEHNENYAQIVLAAQMLDSIHLVLQIYGDNEPIDTFGLVGETDYLNTKIRYYGIVHNAFVFMSARMHKQDIDIMRIPSEYDPDYWQLAIHTDDSTYCRYHCNKDNAYDDISSLDTIAYTLLPTNKKHTDEIIDIATYNYNIVAAFIESMSFACNEISNDTLRFIPKGKVWSSRLDTSVWKTYGNVRFYINKSGLIDHYVLFTNTKDDRLRVDAETYLRLFLKRRYKPICIHKDSVRFFSDVKLYSR